MNGETCISSLDWVPRRDPAANASLRILRPSGYSATIRSIRFNPRSSFLALSLGLLLARLQDFVSGRLRRLLDRGWKRIWRIGAESLYRDGFFSGEISLR
jgi:hypothetical protein